MLTGDSLFVGDVARPDLAVERTEGARGIYPLAARPAAVAAGLRRGLAGAPRRVDVRRPGHGPQGRLDDRLRAPPQRDARDRGRAGVRQRLGRQARSAAPELQGDRRAQPRSAADRRRRASAPVPGQLEQRQREGALVVDVRTDVQFAEGHVPGSISIPLHRGGFGTKLAWVAAGAPADRVRGTRRRGRSSRRQPRGRGRTGRRGSSRWVACGRLDQLERRGPSAGDAASGSRSRRSAPELDATPPAQVLDVREVAEFEAGAYPRIRQRALARHRRDP